MKDQQSINSEKRLNVELSNANRSNSYLQNQLLIAMPNVDDPYFERSVTLICQHNEEGCFGLTINKPIQVTIDEILESIDEDSPEAVTNLRIKPKTTTNKMNSSLALRGGPVQVEQGFVVHDGEKTWENTLAVCDDLAVTASRDILLDIKAGNGPENFILTLGCASWESGQIEEEVLNNAWISCPVDKRILFDMPHDKRWQGAADTLGFNIKSISTVSGHD